MQVQICSDHSLTNVLSIRTAREAIKAELVKRLPTQFSPQGQINLFQNKYLLKKNKLQSNDDFLHSYNKQKLHAEDEIHH